MAYLKKYGLRLLYTFIFIIIALVIMTTLYYFNIIGNGLHKVLKIVIVILSIFINSFILGKNAKERGYLEGSKLSFLVIVTFLILSLLTKQPLKVRHLLYYVIILTTSILGSMIGISRKKD